MVPAARGVGFAQVIGTSSVVSYYCVLIALSIYYLVASCQATLPWTVCWEELKVGGICSLHGTQHICTKLFQQNNTLCMEGGLARNVSNATSVGTVDVERINLVRCQFRNIYHYHSVCHNSLTYDLHSDDHKLCRTILQKFCSERESRHFQWYWNARCQVGWIIGSLLGLIVFNTLERCG